LIALIVPELPVHSVADIFDRIERVRTRTKRHTKSERFDQGRPTLAPFVEYQPVRLP
jgi:hypothetical protein